MNDSNNSWIACRQFRGDSRIHVEWVPSTFGHPTVVAGSETRFYLLWSGPKMHWHGFDSLQESHGDPDASTLPGYLIRQTWSVPTRTRVYMLRTNIMGLMAHGCGFKDMIAHFVYQIR